MGPLLHLIRLAQDATAWLRRHRLPAQLLAGAVAFGLGLWGWSIRQPATGWDGVLNNLFRTLQLITLQFPTSFEGNIPWQLQVARLAVPAVAALATLHVLVGAVTRPVRLALLPRARGHVVVCGAEGLTLGALTALAARGRQIVVVGPAMEAARRETLEGLGLTVAEGDPRAPATYEALNLRHAAAVFLTGEDEVANLNAAMLAMEAARGRPPALPPLELAVLVDREDLARELDAALDSLSRAAGLHYHRLCPDREGLRLELARLAPGFRKPDRDRRSHLLVVGLHGHWEQVLAQLILAAQDHPEEAPLLTVVADATEAAELEAWRATRPELPLVAEIALLPRAGAALPDAALAALPPPDLAVVLRPDAEALAAALALRRPGIGLAAPVLVRQSREDRLLSRIGAPVPEGRLRELVPFGGLIRAESIARALDRQGDELAIALHAAYQDRTQALPPGSPASVAAWDGLPENLRDANRAAAAHAPVLFAAAGLRIAPRGEVAEVPLDAATLERLARIEHRRWMADRIERGWRHGAARDDARRLHPSLAAYAGLPEPEREKDRAQIRSLVAILGRMGRVVGR